MNKKRDWFVFGEKLRFTCKIEILYEDGTMQEIGRGAELMPVGQHLTYILKDGKQTYKPLFLISGYRYVLLKNWPEKVQKENFKSIAVYSDLKITGKFTCSNELINKLEKMYFGARNLILWIFQRIAHNGKELAGQEINQMIELVTKTKLVEAYPVAAAFEQKL